MTLRKADWQANLLAAVRDKKHTVFEYGSHDCCTAAADVIKAAFDIDLMIGLRGRYRSAAGAMRVIRNEGFDDLRGLVTARVQAHGGKPIAPAFATMGNLVMTDTALHDQTRGEAVGVCAGRKFLFPGEVGWITLGRGDLITAFRLS
ncbi:hypothetical protein [Kordiimonas sp. SCSIO 12610]|uniref:DUF6950 family protein n=1 Tax=Kordiimonas sp. SCSIO 12610 TaxID=2829597 RepID=UPI002109038A|nr:hypothetical protein [Kordiimonas sp. SCSIO 12610]UTW56195.1 hypothetical protein KFF44_04665 [Kordiimonas sp. SCSIO 12610]